MNDTKNPLLTRLYFNWGKSPAAHPVQPGHKKVSTRLASPQSLFNAIGNLNLHVNTHLAGGDAGHGDGGLSYSATA